MTDNIQISVMNRCTVLTDAQIQEAVGDLQIQVSRDFAKVYGRDAKLLFVPKDGSPYANTWWLVILDNSDVAGALGYHDLTPEGLPIGKVFAGTDIQYKSNWTITASHELLEMLGDPDVNLCALFLDSNNITGKLYAYEVCDACEGDQFGYKINNTWVSDFVYPPWFESLNVAGTQYDYCNKITAPLQLLANGYIGVLTIGSSNGWQQVFADKIPTFSARPKVGSRRERRRTPRSEWIRSKP